MAAPQHDPSPASRFLASGNASYGLFCLFVAQRDEWIYFGRTPPKRWLGLLIALIMAGLVGGYWMQPKMKELHRIKYGVGVKSSQAERDAADHSFRAWHGAAQGMNLLMLAGLGLYLWRVANPDDPARFVSTTKFRG